VNTDDESIYDELTRLNNELVNLQREMAKKNAELARLNELKNQFLGMAAHDLRRPIGLILTYSEFLIDDVSAVLNAEQRNFLETIYSSSHFMKRLVDDFLDISAIEAGRFDLDLQPVAINDVLTRSLKFNKLQADKKQIVLESTYDENLPRVLADASKIEQVIINIVSNAIEHSNPRSMVKLEINADDDYITMSITDEGPGIPVKEHDRIFRPFEKTSVKKTGGEKSTGLGMLISRKIIEAHRGKIWLESKVGSGTTVFFTIPINMVGK